MPSSDSSDYIRRLKLATIKNATDAAEKRKFRIPTRNTAYNPFIVGPYVSAAVCIDVCSPKTNHNLFAAEKYKSSKVPHFN